jgi:hypothetical protein
MIRARHLREALATLPPSSITRLARDFGAAGRRVGADNGGGGSLSRIAYSADQRKVSITTTSPVTPTWKVITECRYDGRHRLVKETTTSYEYGGRVSIAKSGGRTTYLYHDANGNVVRGIARGPNKWYIGDRVQVF